MLSLKFDYWKITTSLNIGSFIFCLNPSQITGISLVIRIITTWHTVLANTELSSSKDVVLCFIPIVCFCIAQNTEMPMLQKETNL